MTTENAHFAPAPEAPPTPTPETPASDAMPRLLRGLGAVLLVIAASSFMFRDWGQHDDVTRYLMLLGQLGLLAAAGFFCGLKLEEKRGARTFLSLVVAIVPVHFAVLGGILYSQLALDAPESHLAAHAIWQATDPTTAVGLILGAQLLIFPATFVAMMTLVRRHALPLTFAFVGMCATLLFPMREPMIMAGIVAVMAPLVLFLSLRVFSGTPALATPQGRFVRAMLSVPLFVLIARTLLYYPATAPFIGVTLFAVGLMSFVVDVRSDSGRGKLRFAVPQLAALSLMCIGWGVVVWAEIVWPHLLSSGLRALDAPLLLAPWGLILLAASRYTSVGTLMYRRFAALLIAAAVGLNLLAFHELVPGLVCLASGVALTVYGAQIRQKVVAGLGGLAALGGLITVAALTIEIDALTHWGSLTVFGVALIFAAAILDRNRQRLLRRMAMLRGRMRGWSY